MLFDDALALGSAHGKINNTAADRDQLFIVLVCSSSCTRSASAFHEFRVSIGATAEMAWFDTFFDGLYREVLPVTFDDKRTRQSARMIARLLKLRRGQRVLDVPCGMGRIAIPLARQSFDVTGVDLTPQYLARARRNAKKTGVTVRWIQNDMRRIDFEAEFDAAFNWFGSFGYFSERGNLAYVRRVFAALRPGGRFLTEGINKPWLSKNFQPDRQSSAGGVLIQNHARFDRRNSRIHDNWTLSKGGRVERHRISIRIYSGSELRELLRSAGFGKVELYGYPPLGPLTRASPRLMAVATKPR
jgi:SAM-dependent methyltransferase